MKRSYEYLVGGPAEWRSFQERTRALKALGQKVRAYSAADGADPHVQCRVVDIWSDGTRMTGTLWTPREATSGSGDGTSCRSSGGGGGGGSSSGGGEKKLLPGIVMAHGWGGIRDHLDARFGRAFALAGFAVLTFDYRGWNDSDGMVVAVGGGGGSVSGNDDSTSSSSGRHQQDRARASDLRGDDSGGAGSFAAGLSGHIVRQTVDMRWQLADLDAAVHFLDGEPRVDPSRLGLWGVSQGGGHVVSYAALDRGRIRAAVALVPSMGRVGAGDVRSRDEEARRDAIARARGTTTTTATTLAAGTTTKCCGEDSGGGRDEGEGGGGGGGAGAGAGGGGGGAADVTTLLLPIPQGVARHHLPGMDGVPVLHKLTRCVLTTFGFLLLWRVAKLHFHVGRRAQTNHCTA